MARQDRRNELIGGFVPLCLAETKWKSIELVGNERVFVAVGFFPCVYLFQSPGIERPNELIIESGRPSRSQRPRDPSDGTGRTDPLQFCY